MPINGSHKFQKTAKGMKQGQKAKHGFIAGFGQCCMACKTLGNKVIIGK